MRHLVSLYIVLAATLAATLPVPLAETSTSTSPSTSTSTSTKVAARAESETRLRTEEPSSLTPPPHSNLTEKVVEKSLTTQPSNGTDLMARSACQRAKMMIRDEMVPDDAHPTMYPAISTTKRHRRKKKKSKGGSMIVIVIIVVVLCCLLVLCLPLLCLCGCCGLALSPCLGCLACCGEGGGGCCGSGDDDD